MTTTTTTAPKATAPKASPKAAPKATAKVAPKAVQAEVERKLTKTQQASWDTLIKATKDGIQKYLDADKAADDLRRQADTIKVYSARAVAKLMAHPAMVATRGPKAGTPALSKVATATGYPSSTLEPLFKAAETLIKRGWDKRTTDPKDEELAVIRGIIKSENERKYAQAGNGGGKGKGKGSGRQSGVGTKVTFATLQGQLKALREATAKFTADNGFTVEQADDLQAGLDELHDVIESATAGRKSADAA